MGLLLTIIFWIVVITALMVKYWKYLAEITYLDGQVGGLLRRLCVFVTTILWIAGVPVLLFNLRAPYERGPSVGSITTTGVFAPGGIIHFDVDIGYSLKGYYHAKVAVIPLVSGWKGIRKEYGNRRKWSDEISTTKGEDNTKKINFRVSINIPGNSNLSGKEILIDVIVDPIIFPIQYGGSFINREYALREKMRFAIENNEVAVSKWKWWRFFGRWLRLLSWLVWIFGLFYIPEIVPRIIKKL